MSKYLLNIVFISSLFSAYYAIGDTVNIAEHLNHPIEICHGPDGNNTGHVISLSDNAGGITVIGLEIPWWTILGPSSSLETLSQNYGSDNRVHIMQNLDDIGQPFSCEQWSNVCGSESYDIIDDGSEGINDHFLFDLFSLDNYWHSIVILDHNMVFRYYCECNECLELGYVGLVEIVDGLISEINMILGDVNYDGILNIQDVILTVNLVLDQSNEYQNSADLNSDNTVDILDIVQLVNIILN